jgi:hypothetical protein
MLTFSPSTIKYIPIGNGPSVSFGREIMPMATAYCFSIFGNAAYPGIQPSWEDPDTRNIEPLQILSRASPSQTVMIYRISVRRAISRDEGVLLAVYPHHLLLGDPLAPDLKLWVGGEQPGQHPIALSRNCDNRQRRQRPLQRYELFFLVEGEEIILVDTKMAVAIFKVTDNKLVPKPINVLELVAWLCREGLNHRSVRGIDWAFNQARSLVTHHGLSQGLLRELETYREKQMRGSASLT